MMRRYVFMYAGWLVGVFAMAATALVWYRYVEDIGARELASRLRSRGFATEATEDTEVSDPDPFLSS